MAKQAKTVFKIQMTVTVADNNGPIANSGTLKDEVVKAMKGIYHQQLNITELDILQTGRINITPKVIKKDK